MSLKALTTTDKYVLMKVYVMVLMAIQVARFEVI